MAAGQTDDSLTTRNAGRKVSAWLVGVMATGLLVLYWAYLPPRAPRGAFYTGDQGIRLMQLEGMERHGFGLFHNPSPGIDPDVEFFYDPAIRWPQGHPAWMIPPFFALITLPTYKSLGLFGLYVLPALGAVLTVVALWRGGNAGTRAWHGGLSAAALFALASPALFYGAEFSEHAIATALAVAGLCCWLATERWWGAACCGVLCAAAAFLRTECVMMLPATAALMCLTLPRGRRAASIAALCAGASTLLALLAALNLAWYGTPFGLHASANVDRSGLLGPRSMLGPLREVLLPAEPGQVAAIGIAILLKLLCMVRGASLSAWGRTSNWAFAGALVCVALSVTVPPVADKALVVVAPWVLCVLGPLGLTRESGSEAAPREGASGPTRLLAGLLVASAVYVLPVLLAAPGTGGALWGPRFLLPALGLLAVAAATAVGITLARTHGALRVAMGVGFVALFLAGGWNASRSLGALCSIKHQNEMMLGHLVLGTAKNDVIISDTWWLAQVNAALVYDRHFFIIPEGPEAGARTERLLRRLRAVGIERVHYVSASPRPTPVRSRIEAAGTLVRSIKLVPYKHTMATYALSP